VHQLVSRLQEIYKNTPLSSEGESKSTGNQPTTTEAVKLKILKELQEGCDWMAVLERTQVCKDFPSNLPSGMVGLVRAVADFIRPKYPKYAEALDNVANQKYMNNCSPLRKEVKRLLDEWMRGNTGDE